MFDEARLDDEDVLTWLDQGLTLRVLAGAGAQVRIALAAAQEAGLERLRDVGPRGVVVAAAGGSAAVADIFVATARSSAALPVQSCTSGPLPGWVGALDLVIAVSQSGRAAGALSMAAGVTWFVLHTGARPAYVHDFLPGSVLVGVAIGLTFPSLSAASASTNGHCRSVE